MKHYLALKVYAEARKNENYIVDEQQLEIKMNHNVLYAQHMIRRFRSLMVSCWAITHNPLLVSLAGPEFKGFVRALPGLQLALCHE